MLTDTHAHLCDPVFDPDRAEVLQRAADAGVGAVILVGEDLHDAQRNLKLAAFHSMLKPAAGLYPAILDRVQAENLQGFIRKKRDKLVAIGEVGLDFWVVKEDADKQLQREIFTGFINLAKQLDLPLNVHSRSAGRHVIALLIECGATRVQLHAFDGKYSAALPAAEAGYFFSIPPSVVRSRQKQKLVKRLSLTCLLVETDSPVLGPRPDERNEPANVRISINAIAELKGVHEDQVIEAVNENTRRLYGDSIN
jgi:TatD DNase family protein